jgi:hypothetical protein
VTHGEQSETRVFVFQRLGKMDAYFTHDMHNLAIPQNILYDLKIPALPLRLDIVFRRQFVGRQLLAWWLNERLLALK